MVKRWSADIAQGNDPQGLVKLHASAAVQGVRATGEGVVMGSILGAFHALNPSGLDVKVPGTTAHVPVDALAALVGLAGGVGGATAPHGMGKTVANMGAVCAGIYGFRQTNDLIAKMRAKKAGATGGQNLTIGKASFGAEGVSGGWAPGSASAGFEGEDPILKAARNL
jgi:hypothetical protein